MATGHEAIPEQDAVSSLRTVLRESPWTKHAAAKMCLSEEEFVRRIDAALDNPSVAEACRIVASGDISPMIRIEGGSDDHLAAVAYFMEVSDSFPSLTWQGGDFSSTGGEGMRYLSEAMQARAGADSSPLFDVRSCVLGPCSLHHASMISGESRAIVLTDPHHDPYPYPYSYSAPGNDTAFGDGADGSSSSNATQLLYQACAQPSLCLGMRARLIATTLMAITTACSRLDPATAVAATELLSGPFRNPSVLPSLEALVGGAAKVNVPLGVANDRTMVEMFTVGAYAPGTRPPAVLRSCDGLALLDDCELPDYRARVVCDRLGVEGALAVEGGPPEDELSGGNGTGLPPLPSARRLLQQEGVQGVGFVGNERGYVARVVSAVSEVGGSAEECRSTFGTGVNVPGVTVDSCDAPGQQYARINLEVEIVIPDRDPDSGARQGFLSSWYHPAARGPGGFGPARMSCYGFRVSRSADAAPDVSFSNFGEDEGGAGVATFRVRYSTAWLPMRAAADGRWRPDLFYDCSDPAARARFDVTLPVFVGAPGVGSTDDLEDEASWVGLLKTGRADAFLVSRSMVVEVGQQVVVSEPSVAQDLPEGSFDGYGVNVPSLYVRSYAVPAASGAQSEARPLANSNVARGDTVVVVAGVVPVPGQEAMCSSNVFVRKVEVSVVDDSSPYADWPNSVAAPQGTQLPSPSRLASLCSRADWAWFLSSRNLSQAYNPVEKAYLFVDDFVPVARPSAPAGGLRGGPAANTTSTLAQTCRVGSVSGDSGRTIDTVPTCDRRPPFGHPGVDTSLASESQTEAMFDSAAFQTWEIETGRQLAVCVTLYDAGCDGGVYGSLGRRLSESVFAEGARTASVRLRSV